jgi:hypothetical protein
MILPIVISLGVLKMPWCIPQTFNPTIFSNAGLRDALTYRTLSARTRGVPVYSKAYGTSTPYGGFMNDWATRAVKKRERMCDAGVQLGILFRRPLPLFSLFFHSCHYPSHCIPHLFQRLFSLLSTCHYWSRETSIFLSFFSLAMLSSDQSGFLYDELLSGETGAHGGNDHIYLNHYCFLCVHLSELITFKEYR